MQKSTATIALMGDVVLPDFAKAVQAFSTLMNALSAEVAKSARAEWTVQSLEISSAIITTRGYSIADPEDFDSIERVVDSYEDVARSIQDGKEIRYSKRVQTAAGDLVTLIDGKISSIRFETEDIDAEVFSPTLAGNIGHHLEASAELGSAQGRVQSMSSRGILRFTLYDSNDDHAISCYLREGSENAMRDAWGKLAIVEGLVRRNPVTGLISTIREVDGRAITVLHDPDSRKDWRQAIRCAPAKNGSISPEEAIRRMRDE